MSTVVNIYSTHTYVDTIKEKIMNKNLARAISFPLNQENLVIDPDLSVRVKNLSEGIFTVRKDINPDSNSHVAIYGNTYETNNREAINNWVLKELMEQRHDLHSLLIKFHFKFYDLETEITGYTG